MWAATSVPGAWIARSQAKEGNSVLERDSPVLRSHTWKLWSSSDPETTIILYFKCERLGQTIIFKLSAKHMVVIAYRVSIAPIARADTGVLEADIIHITSPDTMSMEIIFPDSVPASNWQSSAARASLHTELLATFIVKITSPLHLQQRTGNPWTRWKSGRPWRMVSINWITLTCCLAWCSRLWWWHQMTQKWFCCHRLWSPPNSQLLCGQSWYGDTLHSQPTKT